MGGNFNTPYLCSLDRVVSLRTCVTTRRSNVNLGEWPICNWGSGIALCLSIALTEARSVVGHPNKRGHNTTREYLDASAPRACFYNGSDHVQHMGCTLMDQVGSVYRGGVRLDEACRGGIQLATQRIHNLRSPILFIEYVAIYCLAR